MNIIWQLLAKFRSQIVKGVFFILFGIGIIALLAQFTDFPQVIRLILETPGKLNFFIFLPLFVYFGLKFWVERFLIQKLGLAVTLKRITLLFAVAELVREFPTIPILMGVTAATKQGEKFFPMKLFSALIPQLPLEIAACFLILALFGFGNLPFLQLSAFLIVVLIFFFLFLMKKIPIPAFLKSAKSGLKKRIGNALLQFKIGLEQIVIWQNLITSFLLIFFYLLSLATVLYYVGIAAGFTQFKLTQAWSTFALIYIALVFSPLPADWGVSESAGFILLPFLGSSRDAALASMLTFRIIFSSATYLVAGLIFWFLWRDIKDFLFSFVKLKKQS